MPSLDSETSSDMATHSYWHTHEACGFVDVEQTQRVLLWDQSEYNFFFFWYTIEYNLITLLYYCWISLAELSWLFYEQFPNLCIWRILKENL